MKKYIPVLLSVILFSAYVDVCNAQTFTTLEKNASFPGGEQKMIEYLAEHITYPIEALQFGGGGMVYVEFVVGVQGEISQPKILKTPGYGFDDEVIQVVKNMPKWIPAENNSEKVRSQFVLPVSFEDLEGGYSLDERQKAKDEYSRSEKSLVISKPSILKLDSAIIIYKELASKIKNSEDSKDCKQKLTVFRNCSIESIEEVDALILNDYLDINCLDYLIQSMQYLKDNELYYTEERDAASLLYLSYKDELNQYAKAKSASDITISKAQIIARKDLKAIISLMDLPYAHSGRIEKFWKLIKPGIELVYGKDDKMIENITERLKAFSVKY